MKEMIEVYGKRGDLNAARTIAQIGKNLQIARRNKEIERILMSVRMREEAREDIERYMNRHIEPYHEPYY